MRIIECKWAEVNSGRRRIILSLKDENGREAFGEISPFPSLNQETVDEAFAQLKSVSAFLKTDWTKIKKSSLFPSVKFGIESTLAHLKDPLPAFSCPFSALLQGSIKDIYQQAEQAAKLGIKSAKIKLGLFSINDAREVLKELKNQFHLRIDLNQKWETTDVLRFFSSYTPTDFDYIEDPLKDLKKLSSFLLPFAMDARPNIDLFFPMKTLVVKPTILNEIPSLKVPKVLSSCFDTGLNIFHLAGLAKRLNLTLPHGFGPYLFLEKDVLDQNLTIEKGCIQIPTAISLNKNLHASLSHF